MSGVRIAFLTSGGDAPGMNAAIRAIVRMSIYRQCEPYAILEGFRGLVQGGSMIVPFGWNNVAHIISEGGTIIKSSRCPEFRERPWRKRAALNLINYGIDKLIVIGGDGSLTGADTLRREWPELLAELVHENAITQVMSDRYKNLMVVGLVGSIDNDMVGTEITIGANSSLHRIIEAVDCIHSTASSHQRAFVIEVMGRHCGWLALNAAISAAADWLLIPEDPPTEGWEQQMCATIQQHRSMGRSTTIVIIAEGAVDRKNCPIRSEYVRDVLINGGLDARVTTLGHVQRGGSPSAFDRYLGTIQGVKAVECILEADPSSSLSLLVGMNENKVTMRPLMECVIKTRAVEEAMRTLQFGEAFRLRDSDFQTNYSIWRLMLKGAEGVFRRRSPGAAQDNAQTPKIKPSPFPASALKIGIMNCGAPCGGMNAAVAASFLYGFSKGYQMIGIFNGFEGLLQGETRELALHEVFGLVCRGGSTMGTNRQLPQVNMAQVAACLGALQLDALIIVGGFEGFTSALQLAKARKEFSVLTMPIVVLPATISNNVPGTEYSIGSDTALNVIVQSCDYIRQSASSSRQRVFVVDVQGGYCGYLSVMAGLAVAASRSYIHEEGLSLESLRRDIEHLRGRFQDNRRQGRLVVRNECCSPIYTAELISRIFETESCGTFDSRWVVLGHLQQGGPPSPLDRIRAVRLSVISMRYIESLLLGESSSEGSPISSSISESLAAGIESPYPLESIFAKINIKGVEDVDSASELEDIEDGDGAEMDVVVLGIKGSKVRFTPASRLEAQTDMKLRRPQDQWWMSLRHYSNILAKHTDQ